MLSLEPIKNLVSVKSYIRGGKMSRTNNKALLGSSGILIAAVLWGFSFVVVKKSVNVIPAEYLMVTRYTISTVILALIFIKRLRNITRKILSEGAVLGFILFISQYLQTIGSKYTTAGKAAFITAAYVVLVPFLSWLIYKNKVGKYSYIASAFAMVGIALLSLQENLTLNNGDILIFLCSIGLGFHILIIDKYTKSHDPILLTILQFFFANLFSLLMVFIFRLEIPHAITQTDIILQLLYLGVFSTMIAFLLQIVCQKYTPPNVAAILLSLEAVFGMIFSVIFTREPLTIRMVLGCVLMFVSIIIAELKRE